MMILMVVLAFLALWGVLASIVPLRSDGYGRPEIRDRNRGPERLLVS